MADLKTRRAVKGTVKTIDRAAVAAERLKSAAVRTKDAAERSATPAETSPQEYGAQQIKGTARRCVAETGVQRKNADSAGSPMRNAMPVKHGTTFRNARMRSREPSRKKPHSKRFRKPERVRSKRHSPPERAP